MKAYKVETDMKDETRIALLEQSIGHIGEALIRIEKKMDDGFNQLNVRMDRIEGRMDGMEGRMDAINSRLLTHFYWTAIGFASVLGLIAHALKWI